MEAHFEYDNDVPSGSVQDILAELAGGQKKPKYVTIYTHARLDPVASREAGHRVYDEVPFIITRYKARDDAVSRPVSEEDKRRFPREWERYESKVNSAQDPNVDILPACTVALAAELTSMGHLKISSLLAHEEQLGERFTKVIKQAKAWVALNAEEEEEDDAAA
jgi:hypothetical protein